MIIVIRCYFWPLKGMPEAGEIHLIHFTPSFVSTFPVQVFAFTCAQNVRVQFILVDETHRYEFVVVPYIQRTSDE